MASFTPRAGTATDTAELQLIAHAKLPDDLTFHEFTEISEALRVLISFGYYAGSGQTRWDDRDLPDAEVRKVQYGSDFLTIVVIAGAVGVALRPLGQLIESVAKSWDTFQAASLKREERLGKKEERLAAKESRLRNQTTQPSNGDNFPAIAELTALSWGPRESIQQMQVADLQVLASAITVLAQYKVSVRIQNPNGKEGLTVFVEPGAD
ncbi:hypothetical protein [Microbacterium sp. RURRCA19A]|uniref:hypothetical protein n=1 Tax=Microbacterium sp. RURRCA19A TaxID=1907391 RepID=UPI000956BF8E|nr:hypothetical protein [Microbacterium sp. RURRCA19A]SIS07775.1 hypothetical protein SAMN05880568_2585 [Microbacterium sp. RURRCA19A]